MQSTSGTSIAVGGIGIHFVLEAGDSGGAATAFECTVGAGAMTPPPHSHDGFEETVYGLDGVLTFTVDGDERNVAPGDALCIRRGQVHHFANAGTTDARFLSVATPGVFGPEYFTEIRDALQASAGGPPDFAALAQVMQRHGLTPA
jgi:quercetin dioxygenase-like cupin family protein